MSDDAALEAARERSAAARREFHAAADDMFDWLSPTRLKAEAVLAATQQIDEAKAAFRRQMRSRPLLAWSALAAVATLLAYTLRRPVTALVKSGADMARTLYTRFRR